MQPMEIQKGDCQIGTWTVGKGPSINVELLGENDHKINLVIREILILNKCTYWSPFVEHFLHCLGERVDPRLTIVIG